MLPIINFKLLNEHPNTELMNDSLYSNSKSLHQINIWNDDTNSEVNGSFLAISITNIINIEHYDL